VEGDSVNLAGVITWVMLALLIGWVSVVLWATYRQMDAEWRRRGRGEVSRPGHRQERR